MTLNEIAKEWDEVTSILKEKGEDLEALRKWKWIKGYCKRRGCANCAIQDCAIKEYAKREREADEK